MFALMWVKLLVVGLLLGALSGTVYYVHHDGYKEGLAAKDLEWQGKEAKIKADAEAKYAGDLKKAQQDAEMFKSAFDQQAVARLKENDDAAKKLADHDAAARARTERLSVPTGACSSLPGKASGGGSGVASGPAAEARTDLLPETTAAVFGIAADDAGLVRAYNNIVDLYSIARATCNAH